MKLTIQHLYVLFTPKERRYWYRAKIGITDNVPRRVGEISASIKEKTGRKCEVVRFIALPLIATHKWEKAIHWATKFIQVEMTGSGKTEWRWYCNPLLAGVLNHYGGELSDPNFYVLRFFLIALLPLPLDLAVLVIAVFCLELSLLLFGIWAAAQVINILSQTFL